MTNILTSFYDRLLTATAKPHEPWKRGHVRGGMSGFFTNGLVVGGEQSCPRRAFLRSRGVEETPDLTSLLTWEVGYAWERLYAAQGKLDEHVISWSTDTTVISQIAGTSRMFSGRPDHVVTAEINDEYIVETKSVSSHNTFRKIICDGELPPEYLAQLVAYMDTLRISRGVIAVGAFLWAGKARGRKIKPTVREFNVVIKGDEILVDGEASVHTVSSQIDHRLLLATVLETADIGRARMVTPSACAFCALSKGACAKYDSGQINSVEEFTVEAANDFSSVDPVEGSETAETAVL